MLRQMRGRAGRQGKSPVGETYLCCREIDLEPVLELMHTEIPNVSSCLKLENRRLQRYATVRTNPTFLQLTPLGPFSRSSR